MKKFKNIQYWTNRRLEGFSTDFNEEAKRRGFSVIYFQVYLVRQAKSNHDAFMLLAYYRLSEMMIGLNDLSGK